MINDKFVYLLIAEPACASEKSYFDFCGKEPGCGPAWLRAYLFAYQYKGLKGQLSHQLLLGTHKEAMAWQNSQDKALIGQYKHVHNHFQALPNHVLSNGEHRINRTYTMSRAGVHEFIANDFRRYREFGTSISFTQNNLKDINTQSALCLESFDPVTQLYHYTESKEGAITADTKDALKVHKIVNSYLQNPTVLVTMQPAEKLSVWQIQAATNARMTIIIDEFNQIIQQCHTDETRIRAIIKTIQQIDQCHPFIDGNVRCCYILLNKLLDDYGLGKTLLFNPNVFDLHALDELYDLVTQGQRYYQKLVLHQSTSPFDYHHTILGYDVSVSCVPQAMPDVSESLLEQFKSIVIRQDYQSKQRPTQTVYLNLFAAKNTAFCANNIINQLIEGGNYNLALRKLCYATKQKKLILKLLQQFPEVNPLETTSKNQTAFDLLALNSHLDAQDKKEVEMALSQCVTTLESADITSAVL
ncbi:MAG: hypothetical protein CMF38_01115 [Legionellaceae bacterium]|nr:hypothetical protein [Legionellaceae bacterium]HAF88114.1 hypothetical protein [Legionellales bacterium]HCA89101.1 hypothetical protein [Legionellales bacterium]|tara:strand:+ start:1976 stop:3388 length:1413 start_codon:yes stop_codon:yes gene_type:complete